MLEDRKSYYPVTGEAPAWTMYRPGMRSCNGEGHPCELLTRSPWMIVGDEPAVTMVTEDSYVGDHTPRITLPGKGQAGGLMQERLGLIDGRTYTGRIVLAGDPNVAPVTVSLVWGGGASDRDTVVIDKVNPTEQTQTVAWKLEGGKTADRGKCWKLTGPDKWSHNAPGKPRQVDIVETSLSDNINTLKVSPLSVTLVSVALQKD